MVFQLQDHDFSLLNMIDTLEKTNPQKKPMHEEYKKQANEFLEQIQFIE